MQITRTSIVSGKTRTMDLPITAEQMQAYEAGALIQNAFPNLTDDQREFILTGISAEEWDETFPEEDEDEGYCATCNNTGSIDCHCGGDLCICENNGEMPCPDCGF